jgi:D-arabinose 1-dehydrogenase-like Zn-dependent alcohol dehydrogenase
MIKFGLNPSMKFGVVGIGGLGHMAVKFGKVSDSLYEEEEEEEECIHDVCR